jgi:hypothetical protein
LGDLSKVYDIDSLPISETIDLSALLTNCDTDADDFLGFYYTKQALPPWLSFSNDNIIVNLNDSFYSPGATTVDIYVNDSSNEPSLIPVTAMFILEKAPYYPDGSQLSQVFTCCDVEILTLPTPVDNSLSQISVSITPSPPWLTISPSG